MASTLLSFRQGRLELNGCACTPVKGGSGTNYLFKIESASVGGVGGATKSTKAQRKGIAGPNPERPGTNSYTWQASSARELQGWILALQRALENDPVIDEAKHVRGLMDINNTAVSLRSNLIVSQNMGLDGSPTSGSKELTWSGGGGQEQGRAAPLGRYSQKRGALRDGTGGGEDSGAGGKAKRGSVVTTSVAKVNLSPSVLYRTAFSDVCETFFPGR